MKRFCYISLIFLLMINFYVGNVYATEAENIIENTVSEESQEIIETNDDNAIEATAIVIKVGEERVVDNGGMIDTLQDVTVKIQDGEYKSEELEATYNLSYDIEGKIKGYALKEGDKVQVQITEDGSSLNVTVIDFVRNTYILAMFLIFLLSIVVIGGKQGVKAIAGLLVTILAVYFIMIKGIYKGFDPIWTSILTCVFIIAATFVIIGGINKKIVTAAIGTLGGVILAGGVATIFNYLCKKKI